MSQLVERLASLMDEGGGIFLEPDLAQELLAYIKRLEANQIPEGHVVEPREPIKELRNAGGDTYNTKQSLLLSSESPNRWGTQARVNSHGWHRNSW